MLRKPWVWTLAVIVIVHLALRLHYLEVRPLTALASNYPHVYSTSLSLMAGHGFNRLKLGDSESDTAVKSFLDLQRESLTTAELEACLADLDKPGTKDLGSYAYVDASQPFAIYAAAAVWKVFGISWRALEGFYLFLSTSALLCLYLVAYRVSASHAGGLLAAALFAASYESWSGVVDPRDLNPVWFTAFAFATLFGVVDRDQPTKRLWGSMFLLGLAATVGYGFRRDSLILPPFTIVAAVPLLLRRKVPLKNIAIGVVVAILAAKLVWTVGQNSHHQPPAMSGNFHVAFFGNQARCDLLGVENSLQIFRDDAKVASDAMAYSTEPIGYLSDDYGAVTWKMFLDAFRYHVYHWTSRIPLALWSAASRTPQQTPAFDLLSFSALDKPMPILFWGLLFLEVVGLLGLVLDEPNRPRVTIIAAFFAFYTAVWFAADPNPRHWAPFLVPSLALMANGLGLVIAAAQRRRFKVHKPSAIGLGVLFCLWLALCGVTWRISKIERTKYYKAVMARPRSRMKVKNKKSFTINTDGIERDSRAGFVLTIKTGPKPASLICRHLRLSDKPFVWANWSGAPNQESVYAQARETIWWNSFQQSHHRLAADSTEQFIVSFTRNYEAGDRRHYYLKVDLEGDAEIKSVQQVDLPKGNSLQLSTVYGPKPSPGPGAVLFSSLSLNQFPTTPEQLQAMGFPEIFGTPTP